MKILPLLFHCIFYTGSWISERQYEPLIQQLRSHPQINDVQFHKWFQQPPNDTILIGHSLGGYFALQDAMRYPDRVSGVILLNSHFNSRGVMPYFKVPLYNVQTPVLTVLGGMDERLPIRKAMDDIWKCVQDNELDKYFIINQQHGHFTGVTEVEGQEETVQPIFTFINALTTRNFTALRKSQIYRRRFHRNLFDLSIDAVVASRSVNVMDAILQLVIPRDVWNTAHFLWFLTSKPDEWMSFLFVDDDHIFLKGKQKDKKQYSYLLREWVGEIPIEIHDIHLPAIHPSILLWLWFALSPKRQEDGTIIAPRIILKVNENTTYYKVPNPRKFFQCLPESSLLDFEEEQLN